jgi:sigma-B regulation protein RsbU (phosphoserine phosphatase)
MTPETNQAPPATTSAAHRAVLEGFVAAVVVYAVAGGGELVLIKMLRPTEVELTWVSDLVLSSALGIAVYLWRHLRVMRLALTERERAALVIQTQLSLAESMQRRLLPAVPPPADGLEWAAALTPAGRIGGDFYDFVQQSPGTWIVLIADVSGKGIPAAMALTLLRSTFRTLAHEGAPPAELARRLAAALYDEWLGAPYVTCIIGRFDTTSQRLTYTNAGHPPGLLLGMRGPRYLTQGGPPLGLLQDASFQEEALALEAGDICVLVTDGIIEALESSALAPVEAIAERVPAHSDSAKGVCNAVMSLGLQGKGPSGVEQWDDDRTVVVVAARGRPVAQLVGANDAGTAQWRPESSR